MQQIMLHNEQAVQQAVQLAVPQALEQLQQQHAQALLQLQQAVQEAVQQAVQEAVQPLQEAVQQLQPAVQQLQQAVQPLKEMAVSSYNLTTRLHNGTNIQLLLPLRKERHPQPAAPGAAAGAPPQFGDLPGPGVFPPTRAALYSEVRRGVGGDGACCQPAQPALEAGLHTRCDVVARLSPMRGLLPLCWQAWLTDTCGVPSGLPALPPAACLPAVDACADECAGGFLPGRFWAAQHAQ